MTDDPATRDNDGRLALFYSSLYYKDHTEFILANVYPNIVRYRALIQANPEKYPHLQASKEIKAKRLKHYKETRIKIRWQEKPEELKIADFQKPQPTTLFDKIKKLLW